MSIEAIAGAQAGLAPATPPTSQTIQAGPSASIADVTSFQGSMNAAGLAPASAPDALAPAMKAMFTQLEKVNGEAKSVGDYAKAAEAKGTSLTPSEIVGLTVRCQEFMFHCQLTSNIANRTSDGIQQLFKQQG
jgi:hypothetical protein